MAKNFNSTIKSPDLIPGNLLPLIVFKAIQLGTLEPEAVELILKQNGISLSLFRSSTSDEVSNNDLIYNTFNNDNTNNIDISNNEVINNNHTNNNHTNNNSNESHSNVAFGEFSTRGNQLWKTNQSKQTESPETEENTRFLKLYKEFLKDNNLKKIPKFICDFKNAKVHFQNHFIPKVVCRSPCNFNILFVPCLYSR